MTNYIALLIAAVALGTAACSAAETPPAAKPVAMPAAKPPTQTAPASPVAPFTHYAQAGSGGSLTFTFTQADAANTGSFGKFATVMSYIGQSLTAAELDVTVQVGSLATQDKDRDDTLKSADLLDAAKYPTAHYSATSFTSSANGDLLANGKLTLRGVTRDLRLPLHVVRAAAGGLELSGTTTIKRLDFGIGQGDWKSTDTVGNDVKLQFKVPLVTAD
jgi:polyisoprenoid-binding protein YceI